MSLIIVIFMFKVGFCEIKWLLVFKKKIIFYECWKNPGGFDDVVVISGILINMF